MTGEHLDAFIRVDTPGAGRRQLAGARLEAEPAGVGEQMAHGRTRRPGGLVEVECPFLDRYQHRHCGDDFRDRRQPELMQMVTADAEDAIRVEHGDAGMWHGPVFDLFEH